MQSSGSALPKEPRRDSRRLPRRAPGNFSPDKSGNAGCRRISRRRKAAPLQSASLGAYLPRVCRSLIRLSTASSRFRDRSFGLAHRLRPRSCPLAVTYPRCNSGRARGQPQPYCPLLRQIAFHAKPHITNLRCRSNCCNRVE
jgi:hypothetical protein